MNQVEEIRKLKRQYGEAYARLSQILFSEDPIGINFEDNTDEYEPEVGTILPRLGSCQSADDIRQVVHEEFEKWFDAGDAGPPERCETIAKRIWDEVVPGLESQ